MKVKTAKCFHMSPQNSPVETILTDALLCASDASRTCGIIFRLYSELYFLYLLGTRSKFNNMNSSPSLCLF